MLCCFGCLGRSLRYEYTIPISGAEMWDGGGGGGGMGEEGGGRRGVSVV